MEKTYNNIGYKGLNEEVGKYHIIDTFVGTPPY